MVDDLVKRIDKKVIDFASENPQISRVFKYKDINGIEYYFMTREEDHYDSALGRKITSLDIKIARLSRDIFVDLFQIPHTETPKSFYEKIYSKAA